MKENCEEIEKFFAKSKLWQTLVGGRKKQG